MKTVHTRLRAARLLSGLSLADGAQIAGCSAPFLCYVERGMRHFKDPARVKRLMRAYKVGGGK